MKLKHVLNWVLQLYMIYKMQKHLTRLQKTNLFAAQKLLDISKKASQDWWA